MAILNNPEDFVSGENITAAKLNNLVDGATFLGGAGQATDDSTLEVNDGVGGDGSLRVKDLGITSAKLADDAVNGSKIADDSIDSEHYVDGSIDSVHLSADAIDGSKIADDSIDSEHYVDGSIDTAHIADEAITSSKISTTDTNFNVQTSGRIGVGTNTPESLLHAKTGTESVRILQDNKSAITFESGSLADIHIQHDGSSNKLHISHGSTVGTSKVVTVDTNVNFVGINTSSPAAPLEIVSTIGGLIIPRMTSTERNNIPGLGTDGEIIYNTSINKFQGRAGGAWVDFH